MFVDSHLANWRQAVLWPAALLFTALALCALFDVDHRLAQWLFQADRQFPFQHSLAYEFWWHKLPKQLAVATFFLLLLVACLPHRKRSFRQWHAPLWLGLLGMLLASAAIGWLKQHSDVYCPAQLSSYGGRFSEPGNEPWPVFGAGTGNCWPAGHATTGLVFMIWYFPARMMARPRLARALLIGGLMLGQVLGFSQVLRGQHFLSHQLWSTAICWYSALVWFALWHRLLDLNTAAIKKAIRRSLFSVQHYWLFKRPLLRLANRHRARDTDPPLH